MFSDIYSDRKSLGETFPESRPYTASLRAISPKPTPEKRPHFCSMKKQTKVSLKESRSVALFRLTSLCPFVPNKIERFLA